MPDMPASAGMPAIELTEEDRLRAACYRLLARFLAMPPDEALLEFAAGLDGDETEIGTALRQLAEAARSTDPQSAAREYHELFIGVGRGELLPFGSYYLTGFLNERPLARLRQDMAALGIARADDVREPEDHIAAELEMMAGLIEGDFGPPLDLKQQQRFLEAHLAPWARHFFADLEGARSARLYRAVGGLGRAFMAVEMTAMGMES